MKGHRLTIAIVLTVVAVSAVIASVVVPADPPPDCARIDVSLDGERSGVAVCVGGTGSVELTDGARVEISVLSIGSREEVGSEVLEEADRERRASPLAERLLPWLIGAGALLVAALLAVAVGALILAHKIGRAWMLLLCALTLPALAEAQPRPGVGLPPMPGASITFAFNADGQCPSASLVTAIDPWALIGDPGALTPSAGVSAATHGPLAAAFRDAWCRRYGGKGAAPCLCPLRGVGGDPHGQTCRPRLEEAFARGLLGAAGEWSGVPNERELDDCIHSEGVWRWVSERLGIVVGGGGTASDGYHRGPLLTLPPDRRGPPHTRKVGSQSAGPADACAWIGRQAVPILNLVRPPRAECCAGMPVECCTPDGFGPQCWSAAAPPSCGDGTCEPPEGPGSCPDDCPVDPPPGPALEILDCDTSGWRVRTVTGDTRVELGAEVTVEGMTVRLPAACGRECTAAEVLGRVRAEVCG